jgi:hypothetical protein
MTTYNGWANRATWNVALWVGNDESTYRRMLGRRAELPRRKFTAATAAMLAQDLFTDGATPDGDKLADVPVKGWAAIARAWNE